MNIRHKIDTLLHTKRIFWKKLVGSFVFRNIPDKSALKIIYRNIFERPLNLDRPQTFNEKLQWLKLYNRNPLYTTLVDKYAVKKWVSDKIGEEYIIPTYGVWDSFDEIDFNQLPNQFVPVPKETFDISDAKEKMSKSLKTDTYCICREWPYKNVPHRIIAEKYIDPNPETNDLPDYKFFCFDGKVKALFVGTERQKEGEDVKFDFFDAEFKHLPFRQGHDHAKQLPEKPNHFDLMKQLAEELSKGIPHVRVDFYDTGNQVFFGEMTFFHFGGMVPFEPEEWDYIFGEWIHLPSSNLR